VSRDEVHGISTHTLHNVGRQKQNILQGIGATVITELQTLFATALKAETQRYRHIPNAVVS